MLVAGIYSRTGISEKRWYVEPAKTPQLRLGDLDSFGD
jgi:hypothetical protein